MPEAPSRRKHPQAFTASFRVRIYELGTFGCISSATCLRYCEQAAMEASENAGYTLERYRELRWIWVVRRTTLEYVAPARYGDVIEVTTWLSRLTRASAFREYLLTRASDGQVIARAQSRWALIDAETLFPIRMPPEMQDLFKPNGKTALEGDDFLRMIKPPAGSEPAGGFQHVSGRRVQRYELDSARHVNNAVYLDWLEQAVVEACAEGNPWCEGGPPFQVGVQIDYLRPAQAGDEIEIHSTPLGRTPKGILWEHQVLRRNDGEILIKAKTVTAGAAEFSRSR